jgi:hypothetical protein
MSPGAYASITKVDFKTLDRLSIKPVGIYGCKDEIVRLLQSLGAVDEELYVIFDSTHLGCSIRLSGLAYYSHQATLVVPDPDSHPVYTS